MAQRTVLAVRHADGHLELLEPVKLAAGAKVSVTLDLPEESAGRAEPGTLPTRKLGPIRGSLTRDEIYADLV